MRRVILTGAVAAGAAAGVVGFAGWQVARALRKRGTDLRGKVALITGGSRGLGLQLARDLTAEGCRVAICARDSEELERVRGDVAWAAQCDVTEREQVEGFVQEAAQRLGTIDIVIANAGVIQVGPLESMETEDFEQAMDTMFWGTFHTIWAALPYLKQKRSGHVVSITSIGGKISVPHLLPYSCAKFAAVALSEGLRPELKRYGIRVLTVVPGLMRTGSHLNAEFKGRQEKEFAWFGLAASLPGMSVSVEKASRQIIRAIRTGRAERVLTLPAQLGARLHGMAPALTSAIMGLVSEYLLPGAGGGSDKVPGHEAERRLDSAVHRLLTTLGRSAAARMNEV